MECSQIIISPEAIQQSDTVSRAPIELRRIEASKQMVSEMAYALDRPDGRQSCETHHPISRYGDVETMRPLTSYRII